VPELPDITIYLERLQALVVGHQLRTIRLMSPFLLRTVAPSLSHFEGATVIGIERIGKRLVWEVRHAADPSSLFLVIHLMIAGRLKWRKPGTKSPGKLGQAAFDFDHATILFTEASKKRRASLHLVASRQDLQQFVRGGLDVMACDADVFSRRLQARRHTVKRALTDPTIIDGIGNAYSDEILHAARLSPFRMTTALTLEELTRLHQACVAQLSLWIDRLRAEVGDGFPEEVTAFRKEMAVHGKYGHPCPDCGQKVQRIVYAENEANYCAQCQTEGRLLADRSLSRLLHDDWPRTLEELEERKAAVLEQQPVKIPSKKTSKK
jgi:formamidopyrimidine-DNA glycosylase